VLSVSGVSSCRQLYLDYNITEFHHSIFNFFNLLLLINYIKITYTSSHFKALQPRANSDYDLVFYMVVYDSPCAAYAIYDLKYHPKWTVTKWNIPF
jgi:hypothetical protein